jgi:hypothetical protein
MPITISPIIPSVNDRILNNPVVLALAVKMPSAVLFLGMPQPMRSVTAA